MNLSNRVAASINSLTQIVGISNELISTLWMRSCEIPYDFNCNLSLIFA